MPVAALGIHIENLQIIIGVIDQISFKRGIGYAFYIVRHKREEHVETVAVLAFHCFGLEGYGFVTRFQFHRFCRLLLFGAQRVYLGNVIVVSINHHHLGLEHWNVKAVLVLNKHNILTLKTTNYSSSHFGKETNFISYFHLYLCFADKITHFSRE